MPNVASRFTAAGPMPGIAETGSGARNAASVPGHTTVIPCGLSRSLAILATILDVATPTEHDRPMASTSGLDVARDRDGVLAGLAGRHVQVALVDGDHLDVRRHRLEDRADLRRDLAVAARCRRDPDGVGSQPLRLDRRHRGAHAETCAPRRRPPRRRRGCEEPPTMTGLPRSDGIVELLDRREERVHVHVQDGAALPRRERRVAIGGRGCVRSTSHGPMVRAAPTACYACAHARRRPHTRGLGLREGSRLRGRGRLRGRPGVREEPAAVGGASRSTRGRPCGSPSSAPSWGSARSSRTPPT